MKLHQVNIGLLNLILQFEENMHLQFYKMGVLYNRSIQQMKKQKFQVYQEPIFRNIIIPSEIKSDAKSHVKRRRRILKKGISDYKKVQTEEQKQELDEFVNVNIFEMEKCKIELKSLNQMFAIQNSRSSIAKKVNRTMLSRKSQIMGKSIYNHNEFKRSIQNSRHKSSNKINTHLALPNKDIRQSNLRSLGNSPYIKNISDLNKVMKMLKPVRGPNESIQKQITKYNDSNKKNHQLVIMRNSNENFQTKRQKYLQRIGFTSTSKVFVMNSKDIHLRQALIERGWHELKDISDSFFHLKWTYSDNANDYSNLNRGQLFNHFYNNQQLTNKNNFRANIKAVTQQNQPLTSLTFDLGISQEFRQFRDIATVFEGLKILNMIITQLKQLKPCYLKRIMRNPNYFTHYKKKTQESSKDKSYSVNFLLKLLQQDAIQEEIGIIQNTFEFISFLVAFIENQTSIRYSIFHSQKGKKKNINILTVFKYLESVIAQQKLRSQLRNIPNFLIVQLIKLQFHFNQSQKTFKKSYGSQNTWIVKPTGVSRGTGIYIESNYQKLLSQANSQHGRIVQKYIQKPFILKDSRKFDIRQWVLVKSFFPLQAFVYNKLYGRICPQKYAQNDFQNVHKHLTNYSLSKDLYTGKKTASIQESKYKSVLFNHVSLKKNFQASIILQEGLKSEVQGGKQKRNANWHQIKLKINQNIIQTLKACSGKIEQNVHCFQVYGFDILLDEDLKPFVLQVNLSPACQKREGLQVYLEQMSHGLIDYIQEWNNIPSKTFRNELRKQQVWTYLQQNQINLQLRQINEIKGKNKKARIIQKWFRSLLTTQKQLNC